MIIDHSTRLVFDTNVLVSAFLAPNSIPAQSLNWGEDNGIILYSLDTLLEITSVLERPKFAKYLDVDDVQGLSNRIRLNWLLIPIIQQIKLCRDTKDDKFIELAINGDASHLVTGDQDLLILHPIQTISVVSPRTFWDEIVN
ncbi:MAG: putative toxin-antitoxin system toxin component, PIN family [Microcystaceae cyanobacterium]